MSNDNVSLEMELSQDELEIIDRRAKNPIFGYEDRPEAIKYMIIQEIYCKKMNLSHGQFYDICVRDKLKQLEKELKGEQ